MTFEDVQKLESMASGHVDYAKKAPLYVADLVMGISSLERP